MHCHLLLGGEKPDKASGNLLLDNLFGCRIHWTGEHRKGEDIPAVYEQLKKAGKKPYVVPYGGSNELGALAFAEATGELLEQSKGQTFTHVVFASSSGGTQAGLMLGQHIFRQPYRVVGISIDKEEANGRPFDKYILSLVNQTAKLVDLDHEFSEQELILNPDYVGEGYGVFGELEKEAISLTARTEGILLDPVYTGRAMGGLIDMIRSGAFCSEDRILFWHTGGTPALFAD